MFRSEPGRPSGLLGSHQPLAQPVDELLVGLRQVGKEAIDSFDDHTPLRKSGDRAQGIQPCLEFDGHTNAQLRIVLDPFSFFGTSRRSPGSTTITCALFGHGRRAGIRTAEMRGLRCASDSCRFRRLTPAKTSWRPSVQRQIHGRNAHHRVFRRSTANWLPDADFTASVSARATSRTKPRRGGARVAGITAINAAVFHGVRVA